MSSMDIEKAKNVIERALAAYNGTLEEHRVLQLAKETVFKAIAAPMRVLEEAKDATESQDNTGQ